jgi:hypothetical protein
MQCRTLGRCSQPGQYKAALSCTLGLLSAALPVHLAHCLKMVVA